MNKRHTTKPPKTCKHLHYQKPALQCLLKQSHHEGQTTIAFYGKKIQQTSLVRITIANKSFRLKQKDLEQSRRNILSEHGQSRRMTMHPLRLRRNEAYHTTFLDTPSYPSRQRKQESGKTSRTLESNQDLGREARPRMPNHLLPSTDYLAPTLKRASNTTTETISHQAQTHNKQQKGSKLKFTRRELTKEVMHRSSARDLIDEKSLKHARI